MAARLQYGRKGKEMSWLKKVFKSRAYCKFHVMYRFPSGQINRKNHNTAQFL